MDKEEIVLKLIEYFKSEDPKYNSVKVPEDYEERRKLLRAFINIRPPMEISEDILKLEDELLNLELEEKGIVDVSSLAECEEHIVLWKGDITRLKVDAIVNACNSGMLGCFRPNHSCIDNQIHTFAGIRLRLECNDIMKGEMLPTGDVRLTKGYNLPCNYVIETVGPIINREVKPEDEEELASCYISSLKLAIQNGIKTIAFPCISTGVFSFPKKRACEVAVSTVRNYLNKNPGNIDKVIFNVYTDEDYEIYKEVLN